MAQTKQLLLCWISLFVIGTLFHRMEDFSFNNNPSRSSQARVRLSSSSSSSTVQTIPSSLSISPIHLEKLWLGDDSSVSRRLHEFPITLVVSHCNVSVSWLYGIYDFNLNIQNITIISKCGTPPRPQHLPKHVSIVELSNVGRIDHTIAYWIVHSDLYDTTTTTTTTSNNKDIVIFLKDNLFIHQESNPRNFIDLLTITIQNGFGCYQQPANGLSQYHETNILALYNMTHYGRTKKGSQQILNNNNGFKSKFLNIGHWWRHIGIVMPQPLVSVCYGGIFAVQKSHILRIPSQVWKLVEQSLARGDNIEEGHYAERTWSGLLNTPIQDPAVIDAMYQMSHTINFNVGQDGGGHLGALYTKKEFRTTSSSNQNYNYYNSQRTQIQPCPHTEWECKFLGKTKIPHKTTTTTLSQQPPK